MVDKQLMIQDSKQAEDGNQAARKQGKQTRHAHTGAFLDVFLITVLFSFVVGLYVVVEKKGMMSCRT
jgi:hypothetical protein